MDLLYFHHLQAFLAMAQSSRHDSRSTSLASRAVARRLVCGDTQLTWRMFASGIRAVVRFHARRLGSRFARNSHNAVLRLYTVSGYVER